jgi:hypothetical protein
MFMRIPAEVILVAQFCPIFAAGVLADIAISHKAAGYLHIGF